MTESLNGARFIAETLKGYGLTHVFFVDAMLRKAMVDLEELGVCRVVTHSEKAAAYMADGYAGSAVEWVSACRSRLALPTWLPVCRMPGLPVHL